MAPEDLLPAFLDLIIWGHEVHPASAALARSGPPRTRARRGGGTQHESKPEVVHIGGEESYKHVLQPGSTIATSLSEGESQRKHTFILEVQGTKFRVLLQPLRCVRPFRLRTLTLSAFPGLRDRPVEAAGEVTKYLQEQVSRAWLPTRLGSEW